MTIETIAIIMSSTVITVFISSIFSFFQNYKNGNLQYITLERKEWREIMRKIAEEINNAECNNIGNCLNKLKVRVNAYGNCANGNVMEDAHIWILIKTTKQASEISIEELEKCKELLIDSISLMLKYDWDRAKWEIAGSINFIFEKLSLFLFVFIYSGMVIYSFGLRNMYTPMFLLIIVFNIIIVNQRFSDYISGEKNVGKKKFAETIISMTIFLFIAGALMYAFGRPLNMTIQNVLSTLIRITNNFIIISIPFFIWLILWYERAKKEMMRSNNYYKVVSEILIKWKKINNDLEQYDTNVKN